MSQEAAQQASEAPQVFDLFGDPVPRNFGGRGRPEHVASRENANRVIMGLALGWNNRRIANALGIAVPTLRKAYKAQLRVRDEQRDRLDMALAMKLFQGVQEGNVSAIREFQAFLDKNDLMEFGQAGVPAPPDKVPKLGKKEQALEDARQPDIGTSLGELMAERALGRQPN